MATGTPRSHAAPTTARAPPPVPRINHPPGGTSRSSRAASRPGTSVLSPTVPPSSPQNVLQAPSRSTIACGRSTVSAASSLCGTVTLPPPPAWLSDRMSPGTSSGRAAERDVHRPQSEDAECGVVHGRGERMRDRVAQDGEDARRAVDHRTVPATRLTTAPMSSCSSAKVAR